MAVTDLTTLLSKFLTSLYAGAINSATDPLLIQVGGSTKLTVSGTAVTSAVGLALSTNNTFLSGVDTVAAARNLIGLDSSDRVAVGNGTSPVFINGIARFLGTLTNVQTGALWISATAPTISSGFGTSPSIPSQNGTAAFTINVGTGGAASSGVLTMPAATTGWVVDCVDITNAASFVTVQTAGTTTSVTLTNYSRTTGLATAWTASDVLRCKAMAY